MSKPIKKRVLSDVPESVDNSDGFTREFSVGSEKVTFVTKGFSGLVNVDDLTSIHMHNLESEFLSISQDLTRAGMLQSLAEEEEKRSRMKREIYSAQFNQRIREEASANSNYFTLGGSKIKLTENSLAEAMLLDPEYQRLANQRIKAETNFKMTSIVYWSLTEKARKLEKLTYRKVEDN